MENLEQSRDFIVAEFLAKFGEKLVKLGELVKNRELMAGETVFVVGVYRNTCWCMDETDLTPSPAMMSETYGGWKNFGVVVDPKDLSVLPVAEQLKKEGLSLLDGKPILMKIKIVEHHPSLKVLAVVPNALTKKSTATRMQIESFTELTLSQLAEFQTRLETKH